MAGEPGPGNVVRVLSSSAWSEDRHSANPGRFEGHALSCVVDVCRPARAPASRAPAGAPAAALLGRHRSRCQQDVIAGGTCRNKALAGPLARGSGHLRCYAWWQRAGCGRSRRAAGGAAGGSSRQRSRRAGKDGRGRAVAAAPCAPAGSASQRAQQVCEGQFPAPGSCLERAGGLRDRRMRHGLAGCSHGGRASQRNDGLAHQAH